MAKLNLIEMRTHQVHFSVYQNHPINVKPTPHLQVDIFVHPLSILRLPSQVVAEICPLRNFTSERFFRSGCAECPSLCLKKSITRDFGTCVGTLRVTLAY